MTLTDWIKARKTWDDYKARPNMMEMMTLAVSLGWHNGAGPIGDYLDNMAALKTKGADDAE